MSKSTNPFLKLVSDSSESKLTGDEGLTEISQSLDQCNLRGSMATESGAPIFPWAVDQPSSKEATTHGSSQVESKLLHNQITTGRDTNLNFNSNSSAYHVSGNLIQVVHGYEESGTPKESRDQAFESRRRNVDDENDVAASMLIPAPSSCILERDFQHSTIVAKLLSIPNAKVAILGMGGIGKTTLACSIANDFQIVEAYSRRLFVSFEGCSTPDLAYTNLAIAFNIPADQRSSHKQILSQVLSYLKREKTLFVVDNFETLWEVSSNRRTAEEFLAQLASLPNLALMVTLRGIQRPGNIRWIKMDPLETLTPDASKELLSVITDEEYADKSEYIQKILDAVAGIPLAVTLIGTLLRDNSETPRSLWHRWTRESTQAISIANDTDPDSDDRLYKLDVSLRLSIFGPRMSDNTREVLVVIAILPIGLNMDDNWLDEFQDILPSSTNIRSCISALRNVALCILESSSSPPRIRLLPPVRDFCLRNMPLNGALAHQLIDMYITDIIAHNGWGSSKNYNWVTVELSNISAILNLAITCCYVPGDFGHAVYAYTEWRRFLCIPETNTVERAIDILSDSPTAKAICLQAYGATLSNSLRTQEAIQPLKDALALHRELADKPEERWDLYFLGRTYYRLYDYANAEHYLSEARGLATEIDDGTNKGSVLQALADIYLDQDKLSQAESSARDALELSLASSDRKGEVNALRTLGRVYHEQEKYDLAIETLTAARDASQAIHDTHMEACANESLGFVYLDTNKPGEAALHLRLAVSLFERAQRPKSVENVRAALMELDMPMVTPND